MAVRRSARLSAATASAETAAASSETQTKAPTQPKSRKRKAAAAAATTAASPETPSTPPRKRAHKPTPAPAAPATPTQPSGSGSSSGAATLADKPALDPPRKAPRHAAVARIADPEGTNAPLLSPETSRVVASRSLDAVSPSKRAGVTTTTANILEEACAHLVRVDPRMRPLVEAHRCHVFSPEGLAERVDPFESLASGIISQQVSGAAARAIKARFVALFDGDDDNDGGGKPNGAKKGEEEGESGEDEEAHAGDDGDDDDDDDEEEKPRRRFPHPSQVAATPLSRLRSAGLSQRKAEYLQGLAAKFASGELSARLLAEAPYDEVVAKLTAVRGLGRWSVEMFACFGLKRMDVFSLGDLGVQRGMAAFVGRDVARLKAKAKGKGGGGGAAAKWKYMSEREMQEISDRFRPYRSVFMWYMWKVEDTDVSTMG